LLPAASVCILHVYQWVMSQTPKVVRSDPEAKPQEVTSLSSTTSARILHIQKWVMSHIFKGVMSHSEAKPQEITSLSSASSATSSTHTKDRSADTKVWDMTQLCGIWLIYVGHVSFMWDRSHVNEICPFQTQGYVKRLIYVGHDSIMWDMTHLCGTWLIHHGHESRGVWLVYVGHDSFMWDMTRLCGTWLIHMWHDLTWVIHTWHTWHDSLAGDIYERTHSCVTPDGVWHDSFICDTHDSFVCDTWWYVTWLIDTWHTWLIHMWHTWLIRVWHTWLIRVWHTWLDACTCDTYGMTHSYVSPHDLCDTTHIHVTYIWHDSFIRDTNEMAYPYASHDGSWHDAFINHWHPAYGPWRIHVWHTGFDAWHTLMCDTQDLTHSYVTWCIVHGSSVLRIHMSTQMAYIAHSHCIFVWRIHIVYSYCAFTLYIRIAHSHCIFILRIHIVYSYCAFTLHIHMAHSHCVFVLRIHIVYSYGAFTCPRRWLLLRIHLADYIVYCAFMCPHRRHNTHSYTDAIILS